MEFLNQILPESDSRVCYSARESSLRRKGVRVMTVHQVPAGRITRNFSWEEFNSKDGAGMPPQVRANVKELVEKALQPLRDFSGPLAISSGYRSPEHNRAVGGAPDSYHVKGLAADFTPLNKEIAEVWEFMERDWPGGLGLYRERGFIHIDARHREGAESARWEG